VVVRIVQLSIDSPGGLVHLSQRPAKATSAPSFTSKERQAFQPTESGDFFWSGTTSAFMGRG
jgi:hypothetical protein